MDIDLKLIGLHHFMWCIKLNQYVNGNTETPPAPSHTQCELGKWIYSEGQSKYGTMPEFVSLEREHQQLHKVAQEIIFLRSGGNIPEAKKLLHKLEEKSNVVVSLIKQLDSKINQK
ncbi:MAG: CZB domain-containing protein [Geminocystis sp.]|nr:CZB domain-containing protein [Geminocystis sp.]HIK36381.1 CZB domain-containing protein [Geminocystis sp. M7585_C2015_104]MCS7147976.1 CZB domain-containing protein [Geminocystis sp.]MCX8078950.1 CZB domain-containing protein [Geminocystis sp.]MDW8116944.1 CZB domain-containing protein [Geminocystis sp.]